MNYHASTWAITFFVMLVAFVLWISYYFAKRTRSAKGYYAAGGTIHWAVNGIAFAGDYLSAASFLGIAGMIAVAGYDGFLYSIGYLAGWIVALFVVAEPMKRLGRYTFADALDSKFNSKGIQLTAGISTLVVSIFYLIPQMVGAGVLVRPLLGLQHWHGVVIVGTIVIIIVATAGMASTTYVQFLKGGLLLLFSSVLVFAVLARGISTRPDQGGQTPYHEFQTLQGFWQGNNFALASPGGYTLSEVALAPAQAGQTPAFVPADQVNPANAKIQFVKLRQGDTDSIWKYQDKGNGAFALQETLFVTHLAGPIMVNGREVRHLYNGAPEESGRFFQVGHMSQINMNGKPVQETGPLDPFQFLSTIRNGTVVRWASANVKDGTNTVTVYSQTPTPGEQILRPGLKFKLEGATAVQKWDFASLLLALFLGTAALPHILIRYYTVPSPADARRSTIVAIAAIGFFYILTLFMGLGGMVSGIVDLTDDNMSAPLLARSFGTFLFANISALAFATVLGTVSGLIIAASGAVAHDLFDRLLGRRLTDHQKVVHGKVAAVIVGVLAMFLGIQYEGMNVSFLVGWAFAVAASANLPAIVMLLFWKRTTAAGIVVSIFVGIVASVGLILLSPEMYKNIWGLPPARAPFGLNSPAIVSVPLSFLTLVAVSLLTQKRPSLKAAGAAAGYPGEGGKVDQVPQRPAPETPGLNGPVEVRELPDKAPAPEPPIEKPRKLSNEPH
ncbi:MAG: cation acetate symporter [Bacillota bacterium]